MIYNYAWERFYGHFYTHQQNQRENNGKSEISRDDDVPPATSTSVEPLNFDSIKQCAEESLMNKGLVYDEQSGYYYDQNTGYYYDQVSSFIF